MGTVFCGKCGNACAITSIGLDCIDAAEGKAFNNVSEWECYDGFPHCMPFGR